MRPTSRENAGMETYIGQVRTPADAIKLFEACRLGLLPRVQRRLSEKERQSIKSGSVFVWDEREAGMRRWTDGKSWSASRVSGSFLTYREMEGKRGTGFGASRRTNGRSPEIGRLDDEEQDGEPVQYNYKTDGLMKQSFSITTKNGQHLHLISYFARPVAGALELSQPSTDPTLKHIIPLQGMYPETSIHETAHSPPLTRMPMHPHVSPPVHADPGVYGSYWAPPAWTARDQSMYPPSPRPTPPITYPRHEAERIQPAPTGYAAQLHPLSGPINHPQHERLPQHERPHYEYLAQAGHPHYERLPQHERPHYERLPQPATWPLVDRHRSLSPRFQQLQEQAAQAVMIDPRAPPSGHNHHGPLPILAPLNRQPTSSRTSSHSPPQPGFSDIPQPRKLSLSSLMNMTPTSSDPPSANPANSSSAGSSPRAHGAVQQEESVDAKAIQSLNRNLTFFKTAA